LQRLLVLVQRGTNETRRRGGARPFGVHESRAGVRVAAMGMAPTHAVTRRTHPCVEGAHGGAGSTPAGVALTRRGAKHAPAAEAPPPPMMGADAMPDDADAPSPMSAWAGVNPPTAAAQAAALL
jgi:hypothetical protein